MKVIFMGTPDFAVPALEALVQSEKHEVSLVVTQPDRPRGRSGKAAAPEVKLCAEKYGIPVFQPEKVKEPSAIERLAGEQADLIVVAAFGQILPKEILEMPRYGCINIHGSLLPMYRGAAPIQWAVLDGQKEAGDTIMQMNEGLDTGDILTQEKVELSPDETAGSLYEKLSRMGGPLLLRTMDELEKGTVTPVPQDGEKSTYAKMLRKEMGNIDWNRSAPELEHLVRGLNPWPSAFTHWEGKLLKIWMAKAVGEEQGTGAGSRRAEPEAEPGTVMVVTEDCLLIQTGNGLLSLTEVQLEGKKRMPVQDFLRGCRIQPGSRFERTGR